MTLLLSISPANRLAVGIVCVASAFSVTDPWALRKPAAVATTLYVPGGAVRLKVPSALAATDATRLFSLLYKSTPTGLLANTCPVSIPTPVGRDVVVGDAVDVGVDSIDIGVAVAAGSWPGSGVDVVGGGKEPAGRTARPAGVTGIATSVLSPVE